MLTVRAANSDAARSLLEALEGWCASINGEDVVLLGYDHTGEALVSPLANNDVRAIPIADLEIELRDA